MNKADIKSGAIFEIPLDKDFGFGYVKLVFQEDIITDCLRKDIYVKIYNLFQEDSMNKSDFNSELFETDDLLLFPMLLMGAPRLRGNKKWRFLGFSKLTDEDKTAPDYVQVGMMSPLTQKKISNECDTEYGCRVVFGNEKNGKNGKSFEYIKDFNRINHLGQWQHTNSDGIRMILTMTWMKNKSKNIRDYYSEEDYKNDFWLEYAQNIVETSDFDFSKVTFDGRLKVIDN